MFFYVTKDKRFKNTDYVNIENYYVYPSKNCFKDAIKDVFGDLVSQSTTDWFSSIKTLMSVESFNGDLELIKIYKYPLIRQKLFSEMPASFAIITNKKLEYLEIQLLHLFLKHDCSADYLEQASKELSKAENQ